MQTWKDINGFEGLYKMDQFGQVKRKTKKGWHLLKWSKMKNGYYFVRLCKNGVAKNYLIHRLVAETFQKPLAEDEDVHHKNRFKFCNCVSNIEVVKHLKHHAAHAEEMKDQKRSQEVKRKISNTLKERYASNQEYRQKMKMIVRLRDPLTGKFVQQFNDESNNPDQDNK